MLIPQIYHFYPRSVIFCNSASSTVLPLATLWLNFNAWPLTRLAPCCLRNTLGADGLHLKGIFGWAVAGVITCRGARWPCCEKVESAEQLQSGSPPPPRASHRLSAGSTSSWEFSSVTARRATSLLHNQGLLGVVSLTGSTSCPSRRCARSCSSWRRETQESQTGGEWAKSQPRFFTFYVGPTKLLYTAPFGDKVSLLSFLESNVWETRYNKIN